MNAQEKAPARHGVTEPGTAKQEHSQDATSAANGKPIDSPAKRPTIAENTTPLAIDGLLTKDQRFPLSVQSHAEFQKELRRETKAADAPARTPANETRNDGNGRSTLPAFLQDLIACPPPHGSGVHQWLFKVARQLHAHRDEQTIVDLLTAAVDGCGRQVPQSEILAAVESARECAWQPNGNGPVTTKPAPKWPEVNQLARSAAIQSAKMTLADLWESSPIYCTQDSTDAEFFADELFPGNPLLCVGLSNSDFTTAPRESFRGRLSEMSLIVPSPMSALTGKRKKDGKESPHTLANTGPRRYLITEFDSGTSDEQAALIWHLRQFAPLVMVVHSGGKSLHAWWDCQSNDDSVTGRFMRYAVSLGADPATWTRVQFVRVPQGWRADKGKRQEVYFFNPNGGKELAR